MLYPITLTKDDNDTFLVECPLVREVTTFGEDEADARSRAVDAILTAFEGRVADREAIPVSAEISGEAVDLGLSVALKVELHNAMVAAGLRKADLTRRLKVAPVQVDRLLDFSHASAVSQIENALRAVGRRVEVTTRAA